MPEIMDVKKQKKPTRKRVISPFSANLRKIIDERNISQKAAAEMAGVSTASINDWLNGAQPNDALAVQKLCTALKCDFEWLLTGNSSKLESKNLTLAQLFDFEDEPTFSGIFEISARRLNRKNE